MFSLMPAYAIMPVRTVAPRVRPSHTFQARREATSQVIQTQAIRLGINTL
jgi:hypothetical protein